MEQTGDSAGSPSKVMVMMPSLPANVVLEIGSQLTSYCADKPSFAIPLIKVSAPLVQEWKDTADPTTGQLVQEIAENDWCDVEGSLTSYRHRPSTDGSRLVVLLIGVDRVTDASSLEDFHHCDLRTIWEEELDGSFDRWTRAKLEDSSIGYDDDTLEHFNWVLQPLVERGLADVLQISTLLQELDFSAAQDGRDAEKVLLNGLGRFGLPQFGNFRFTTPKALGGYLDQALAFYSYDAFMEDRSRKNALKIVDKFVTHNPLGEVFAQDERQPFASDQEFVDGLRDYVKMADRENRDRLMGCDFTTIRDKILGFRHKDPDAPKEKKETVRKVSGGPVEVVLGALWTTLGEFKRAADAGSVFAYESLTKIEIESHVYKNDCDGESAAERKNNAIRDLERLLGGVDRFMEQWIDTSRFCADERNVPIRSSLVHSDVTFQPARTAEPHLQFSVTVHGEGLENPVVKQFAWRLPEIQPYRVADELIRWAAAAVSATDGYCLPVFHAPYYEELMLAKDDEETRRVLLHCIREEGNGVENLLSAGDLDSHDPLLPKIRHLASVYDQFLQNAKNDGLHAALLDQWDDLRKACEQAGGAYLNDPDCVSSPLAAFLFRTFLIIARRSGAEGDRWMWETHEPSCVVTVLHPALLEMLRAQISYLLATFSSVAARELRRPGSRGFRDVVWQGYVDLATIQMPICGLIKDRNRILDTDIRGEDLIHRVGGADATEASLTTRLLLRYDSFDDDDISDTELFRESRESLLICRVLADYRALHPHADDGLSIAIYQNEDIQPVIAAVDKYLRDVCEKHESPTKPYAMAVTIFTESSDDSSVSRWVSQWKDRWEAAETQTSLAHYRQTRLSIAHRIVSADKYYQQFVQLVESGLEVDIAFLTNFIRAGSQGNDFQPVDSYDVRKRTLKFPILEKSFCSLTDPGRRLQRARVLSNRQFLLTTGHAEIMARLKNPETPQNSHHVVLGYGDYTPWQGVVDALHRRAEWVVCIDPNIDERLIAARRQDAPEAREIIGFGSGVGAHGEANFTVSTEHFQLSDVLHKLVASIEELYAGWDHETYQQVAQSVLAESQRLSGLSLVRATGVGQYVRDFMSYALARKLLQADGDVLCDQLVSLDAYQHWFDSADSRMRPDLLWIVVRVDGDGRLRLDLRLIECKLAKMSEAHLDKAREQLENGLRHLPTVFMPRVNHEAGEDERPDQRYWWLQLHRLIASKAEITKKDEKRVLTGLERLADGDYDIQWRASALTFWTDQASSEINQADAWPCSIEGKEIGIGALSAGTEFVRFLCETRAPVQLPWEGEAVAFCAAGYTVPEDGEDQVVEGMDDFNEDSPPDDELKSHPPGTGTSGEMLSPAEDESRSSITAALVQIPNRVLLGATSQGSRKVYWEFGHKELSNRHMLIFGSSGMGKTYTIQCLLCELGRCGQNSLIVDYTNGFFDNQLEVEFKSLLSPVQHVVRRQPLAINPFRQQVEMIAGEPLPEVPSTTAQRVSGVFSEVYNLGDQQKSSLYQAIKTGLEQAGELGLTMKDLIPRLEQLAEDKETQGQSASSVISKLLPFLDQNPFGREDPESWERWFNDALHRCHVVQLAGFVKDASRLVTEFSLIDLYWFYRGVGTQGKPRVVVLDEVQNLDHRDESPLAQLLREGRKFGFSLVLATQIMSNLDKDERDRLFLAGHKLFFRPADTEMRSYAEIASTSTGDKVDVWQKRLAGLKKGECYSLGPSLNEASDKLEMKAFKIQITSLGDRIDHA